MSTQVDNAAGDATASVAARFMTLAGLLDAAALVRVTRLLHWERNLGADGALLAVHARSLESVDNDDSIVGRIVAALAGAAVCYIQVRHDDERARFDDTVSRVIAELALRAAIAPRPSGVREQVDALLASPA